MAEVIQADAVPEPSDADVERAVSTLVDSMREYDNVTNSTQELRRALVAKVIPSILAMDMSTTDSTDPDLFASKARYLEQGRQLLNDLDSAAKNHVNVKLKKTDIEQQHQSNLEIAKLLQQIKLDQWQPDPNRPLVNNEAELEQALEHRCATGDCEVLPSELALDDRKLPTEEDKDDFNLKHESAARD